ncbi:MAG: Lrp/AsnC ligand binding domain-containing protein [Candidatus Bipolaricaulia bacterium]
MAIRAYVLIRCERGTADEVVEKIRDKEHVKRADTIFGEYDAIAYLVIEELPSMFSVRALQAIVLEEIQRTRGVLNTNTHIVTSPEG